jgi:hypothetical protein
MKVINAESVAQRLEVRMLYTDYGVAAGSSNR